MGADVSTTHANSIRFMVREDARDVLVDLREPDSFGIEDVLDSKVEAAVAREQ